MASDAEGTKTRLLAEARDLYLHAGFGGFSLREVARRVGVSAPAVYRHFDGKEALLREVCAAGFRQFGAYLMRALSAQTPRERLLLSGEMYLRFALENPRDYRVIFMGAGDELAPPAPTARRDPTFQFLVDRVRECMQDGVLARGDEAEVAAMIWAHVHGLASLRISGHMAQAGTDAQFARFYARAVERFLAGLGP